jgi:hypothetical protein
MNDEFHIDTGDGDKPGKTKSKPPTANFPNLGPSSTDNSVPEALPTVAAALYQGLHNADGTNIFRDGKMVVVPMIGAIFPPRCVKTNLPVAEADFRFIDDVFPVEVRAGVPVPIYRSSKAQALARLATKERVNCRVGLCQNVKNRLKLLKIIGIAVVPLGFVLTIILSVLLYEWLEYQKKEFALLPMIPLFVSTPLALVLIAISMKSVLSVGWSDGKFVWLSGASPQFLKSLAVCPVRWPNGVSNQIVRRKK